MERRKIKFLREFENCWLGLNVYRIVFLEVSCVFKFLFSCLFILRSNCECVVWFSIYYECIVNVFKIWGFVFDFFCERNIEYVVCFEFLRRKKFIVI